MPIKKLRARPKKAKTAVLKKTAAVPVPAEEQKIRIGWFTFSCSEDNTVVMTEIMNDHWQEWKKMFDFRHVRMLKSHNILDALDIVFIEGAIASEEQAQKLKEIRQRSKLLVAVGACACVGLPAGQRNTFTEIQRAKIEHLVAKFAALPKVLKVAEVVSVDAEVPGCPMDPANFLRVVNQAVARVRAERRS
ncbi:MAG: hypothetical protein PHI63_00805 [Patescibacteria group bacterium]|nr:hypothetical protein [Patescibacteria group bacterium]